jgi:hypothetical protein
MTLADTASIAYAVVSLAQSGEPLAAGVLSAGSREEAAGIAAATGAALGMATVVVDMPGIEYHPGAIGAVAYDQVEKAVATEAPVLFVLDRADGSQRCVLAAIASAIRVRTEEEPCVLLALTSTRLEDGVARETAEGLEVPVDRIARFRTAEENRLLVEAVLGAAG